jgi:phosphoserine phosphatase RsbU/P
MNGVHMRPAAHHMQCLEVWGGNGAADAGVVMPGLDVWVFAKPHGQAGGTANSGEGGDVHYVSSCGTGRISRVLLADVAGHGPAVAMLARTLRDLMRRHVNTVNQAGFVGRMNSEFLAAAEEAGGRFATAVVATFWAPTGYLVACNAGHPRPMGYSSRSKQWRTVEGGVDVEAADLSNLPLGIADDAQYTQFAVRLVAGDVVVLYTDALLECRLPDGRMLGEAGLLDCIRQLDASRPELLASGLYNAVASKCPNPPDDDATVLVLRCSEGPRAASFASRAVAGLRFLAMVAGAVASRLWRGQSTPVPWPEFSLENIGGGIIPAFGMGLGRDARGLDEQKPVV